MALHFLIWLGGGAAGRWLALALSYTLHASIWAVAAALLTRQRGLASKTRHQTWKLALFAPLLTALAVGWPGAHGLGPSEALDIPGIGLPLLDLRGVAVPLLDPPGVAVPLLDQVPGPSAAGGARLAPGPAHNQLVATAAVLAGSAHVLTACAAVAAALGAVRFVGSLWLLGARLRGRRKVVAPALLQRLHRLCERSRVRNVVLSESTHLSSPVAIGTREICMPQRLLESLSDAELDAVLAHELAHIERADGVWFPVVGALQSLLWLQPWNHWVAARFRHSAELACDDRAIELTGDPVGLARALVQAASHALCRERTSIVPAMAGSARTLGPRVERLLAAAPGDHTTPSQHAVRHGNRWRASQRGQVFTAAGLGAAALITVGMGVGVASERSSDTSAPAGAQARRESTTSAPAGAQVRREAATSAPDGAQAGRESATSKRAGTQPGPGDGGATTGPATSPPDVAGQNARLAALERRRRHLDAQLDLALRVPGADQAGTEPAVRVIELRQELDHARATEAWLEQRFAQDWAAWEQGRAARSD